MYLQERHGVHQEAVKKPLSELAHILGYQNVDPSTQITISDTEILLQEIGASGHPLRDLVRFLRARQRSAVAAAGAGEAADGTLDARELDEWGRLQNTKDLLAFARRHGATVESTPRGPTWLRVTTAHGAVIHFKHVGKKDDVLRSRHRHGHKERSYPENKDAIRVWPHVEEPITVLFEPVHPRSTPAQVVVEAKEPEVFATIEQKEDELDDIEDLATSAPVHVEVPAGGGRRQSRLFKQPLPYSMRRESAGRCSGPRRRGPSQVGHLHGRRSKAYSWAA